MKFSVNINQKAIVDLGLHDKLDFIDLAIYDFITEFMLCEDCQKMIIGNEQYFWIKANLIIENLPLLGISTARGVNKRIEKLIDCDLLERCPDNQNLRQSFFKVGKLYKKYKFFTWNENSKPSWNENSNNNIDTEDISNQNENNIDKQEKEDISISSKKKVEEDVEPIVIAPEMQVVVEEWLQYKKEKRQSYKPSGFNAFYKRLCRLSNNNPQIAAEIIEESMSSGYAGIYPPKNNNRYQYGRPKTNTEKFHDTIKSADEFSKKLHENVGKQTEVGNGDNDALW